MTDTDETREFEAEWLQRRIESAKRSIPARFAGVEVMPEVREWAQALAAGTAGNLVLMGPTGRGKTAQAWAAILAATEAGWRPAPDVKRYIWCHAVQLADALRPSDNSDQIIRDLCRAQLLVIDDFGAARLTEWQIERLAFIVDARWQRSLPVLLTTNQPDLKKLLDDRIASRLQQGATAVQLLGPDHRRERPQAG
jgi:DNA replication protein DnaC